MSDQNKELPTSIEMGGIVLHSGDRIGPYRFDKPIGRGGMADVLLALDPNGQPMALKVLKSSRFKTGRRRFRREFRALSKLHHDNVIQVDSFGDIFGHPFFAMEYVEGTDLHKTIRGFKHFSLSARWERTEEILVDLSRGLAYIHSHGLIHRDLKPSNVLINKDGLSKITDFGIVKTFAKEEQENVSTTLVGTWAYASPEQISGRPLDHRSDLYSLGIILYAMLTGRRPFAAENMAGYLKLHRDQPPKTPTAFIPEIPEKLERICLRLLQKAPQDRFQSAQEILEELGRHESKEDELESGPTTFPFAGQQNTLNQIQESIQSLTRGEGGLLTIIGAEGSGKSRTLNEAQKFAKSIDLPVFRLAISPKKNPLDATIELAQKIAKEEGDIRLSAAIKALEDAKGKHDADLRHQLFDCINKALFQLLEERPQIFLIDDIQHALQPLQELIIYINATLIDRSSLPLLFIMSSEVKLDWINDSDIVELKPLSTDDIHRWLKEFCGEAKGIQRLAKRLHMETEGAPLFMVEFIQEMINKKQLKAGAPGKLLKSVDVIIADGFDIPPGIRQLARMKVGGLSSTQKPIIEALSVAGRELDIDTLLDILGGDEERVLDEVDKLEEVGLIAQHRIGIDPIIELTRRKIGEVVYEDLLPENRIHLHRRIAQVLEMNGAAGITATQQIGEHYRLGQQAGKAYQFLSIATVQLWERGLASDALQMLRKATPMMRNAKAELDNTSFLRYRLKLLKVQNEVAKNKGEWQVATKTLRSMIRYAKEIDHWPTIAEAELGLGSVAIQLKQYEVGERRINAVLTKAEQKNDHKNVIDALHLMCVLVWNQGQLDKCEAIANIGLSKTKAGDISISRAKILLSLSATMAARGQLNKAAEGMEEAATIFSKLVRKESHATILINLSEVEVWRGHWQKAIEKIDQSMILSENTLYKRGLAHANVTKAMALYCLGCPMEAKVHVSDGLRLSKDLSLLDNIVVAKLLLAKIALDDNKPITADAHLEEAIRASIDSDPEKYHWPLQALRSKAYAMQKWNKEALSQLKKVESNIQDLPWPRRIETLIYCAQAHEMMGQKSEACTMANYADQKAQALGMKGWSIEAKAILARSSPNVQIAKDTLNKLLSSLKNGLTEKHIQSLGRRYGQDL